jgi:nitroreductase
MPSWPVLLYSQSWRFVFVRDPGVLGALHEALSPNNAWMKTASEIVVVCGRIEDDCVIKDREYTLFDLGLAAYPRELCGQSSHKG